MDDLWTATFLGFCGGAIFVCALLVGFQLLLDRGRQKRERR